MINYKIIKSSDDLSFLKKEIKSLYDKWVNRQFMDEELSYEFRPEYSGPEEFYLSNVSMSDYWSWLRNNELVNKLINDGFILPKTFSIHVMAVNKGHVIGFGYYHAKGVVFGSDDIDYLTVNGYRFIGCFRGNDFVYVDPDYRHMGVGINLAKLIFDSAKENNLPLMISVLNDDFKRSLIKHFRLVFDDDLAII